MRAIRRLWNHGSTGAKDQTEDGRIERLELRASVGAVDEKSGSHAEQQSISKARVLQELEPDVRETQGEKGDISASMLQKKSRLK